MSSELLLIVRPTDSGSCCDGGDCCEDDDAGGGELIEGATCELPWETQVAVLRRRVEALAPGLTVAEIDVWQIGSDDRGLVLTALSKGLQLPFVIVEGSLVCAGKLDISAIVTAVGGSVQV